MERRITSKIAWRILPFIWICYVAAFVDRVNVSFAAEAFRSDLGFDSDVFGTGAGIFFFGYFLFEVPSNLVLHKVGARRWIARIMILWGVISSAMLFIRGPWSFYGLRFLLGAAEAGFFPGMILYLTYWFPSAYRSRTIGFFMTAPAVAEVVGSPLSGWLMDHAPAGLHGWQWLFLIEGLPSLALGLVVLRLLPDGPAKVRWLDDDERAWLAARLDAERAERERAERLTVGQALAHPRVLALCLLCFLLCTGGYGLGMFLPQVVRAARPGLSNTHLGLLVSLPSLLAAGAMLVWSRHSDRTGERRWHTALPAWIAAAALAAGAAALPPAAAFSCLALGVAGRWSSNPPFWSMPTAFLSGAAAAGGIALINSIGNLGGFAGPKLMGLLHEATGTHTAGLLAMAAVLALGGLLALLMKGRSPEDSRESPRCSDARVDILRTVGNSGSLLEKGGWNLGNGGV